MPSEQQLSDVLSEFARTMVTEFPIQAILDHLVERIVDILPVTGAGVTLISPGSDPRYVAASDESALRYEVLQSQVGEGPCLLAYSSGEAVAVADLRSEERFPQFAPRALAAGLMAVFTFPLRDGDHRLGALDLYRHTPGPLDQPTMVAAQTLADVAAAYLLNAQARADLEDTSNRSRQAALHDPLTGLPNRVLVLELLEHALLRGRRSGKTLALLFVDLDRFKAINDTYGHAMGDETLIGVARRLHAAVRPGDTLARLAGDEFIILCEDLDTPDQATAIAGRLHVALSEPFSLSAAEVVVTASIGIAFAGRGYRRDTVASDASQRLLHDADTAMYQAKRQGGARHQILDLNAQHLADYQASLDRDLIGALGRGEMHTEYQPIVDAVNGRMIGVEALIRWRHLDRGMVPPSILIPLAEHSGRITEIGRWVLEEAWADLSRWQSQDAGEALTMSVNVSANQLLSPGFAALVAAVLATVDCNPRLLTLEMTESIFVQDTDRTLVVLNDLKEMGVSLALDDFGTGYSSLGYLRCFPFDVVKVDQTFVADLDRDSASHLIVDAVVHLAHGLGMTVVAEGVETVEQHREVVGLGCDACQGYYFARPMCAASLETLLHDHRIDGGNTRLPLVSWSR